MMTSRRQLVELLAAAVLTLAAGVVFRNAFVSWGFLPSVVAAVVVATGTSYVLHRYRASFGVSALVSLLAYFVFGVIVIFGTPTVDAFQSFVIETVRAWRGLLTTAAPVDPSGGFRMVPFMATWIGSFVAAEGVLRTKTVAIPVIGPFLVFVVAALFGLDTNVLAREFGVGLLLGVVVFVVLRSADSWVWNRIDNPVWSGGRLLSSVGMVAVAGVVALLATPLVPLGSQSERTNLRDIIDPPFEIRDLRTPLVGFKDSLRDDAEDSVVLVVTGEDLGDGRIRLATLNRYDGVKWTAADARSGDSLVPVGSSFPNLIEGGIGEPDRYSFELQDLTGNWLPVVGVPRSLEWGDNATEILGSEPQLRLRVDPGGGNLLIDRTLGPASDRVGLTYSIEATAAVEPTEIDDDAILTPAPIPGLDHVGRFEDLANEIVGQEGSTIRKVLAIEAALSNYDPAGAGTVGASGAGKNPTYDLATPPGHALHRVVDVLFQDSDEYRGTSEQYATAFSLLAGALDIPSRVVVGYAIDPEVVDSGADGLEVAEIRRSDMTVWIEVPFEGVGWTPFQAGPLESAQPEGRPVGGGGSRSLTTIPPPPKPDDEIDESEVELDDDLEECVGDECEESGATSLPTVVIVAGAVGLGLVVLVAALVATILGLKRRRRRKRRSDSPAASIAGAWLELIDLKVDQGYVADPASTVAETVIDLRGTPGHSEVEDLSYLVEDSAYSANEPDPKDADEAWQYLKAIEQAEAEAESRLDSAKRKLSLASFR